ASACREDATRELVVRHVLSKRVDEEAMDLPRASRAVAGRRDAKAIAEAQRVELRCFDRRDGAVDPALALLRRVVGKELARLFERRQPAANGKKKAPQKRSVVRDRRGLEREKLEPLVDERIDRVRRVRLVEDETGNVLDERE